MSAEPKVSISEITTVSASFGEDIEAYRAAGVEGIGIWEFKLGDDAADRIALRESGLVPTTAVPAVPSILPLPLMPGPLEPEARVEALCASVRRLAAFEPTSVLCLTGPRGDLDESEARRVVVEGLRAIAAEAERAGVRFGVEPTQRRFGSDWTLVSSIPETLDLLAEVGRPGVGIMFDTWHLWDSDSVFEDITRHAGRFTGVHVADWREPTREVNDRVFPGDGIACLPALLAALEQAGWHGFLDVEVFSDTALEGSLWALGPLEAARRARQGLATVLDQKNSPSR